MVQRRQRRSDVASQSNPDFPKFTLHKLIWKISTLNWYVLYIYVMLRDSFLSFYSMKLNKLECIR